MQRVVAGALVALLLILGGCRDTKRTASGPDNGHAEAERRPGQVITITDSILAAGGSDTVRFGRLHSGETAMRQLWIANRSTRPVVLLDYERSCGCTTLEFDRSPIAKGEAQRMRMLFDSRGEWGWQLKQIALRFSGAEKPFRIFVEAEVE